MAALRLPGVAVLYSSMPLRSFRPGSLCPALQLMRYFNRLTPMAFGTPSTTIVYLPPEESMTAFGMNA